MSLDDFTSPSFSSSAAKLPCTQGIRVLLLSLYENVLDFQHTYLRLNFHIRIVSWYAVSWEYMRTHWSVGNRRVSSGRRHSKLRRYVRIFSFGRWLSNTTPSTGRPVCAHVLSAGRWMMAIYETNYSAQYENLRKELESPLKQKLEQFEDSHKRDTRQQSIFKSPIPILMSSTNIVHTQDS